MQLAAALDRARDEDAALAVMKLDTRRARCLARESSRRSIASPVTGGRVCLSRVAPRGKRRNYMAYAAPSGRDGPLEPHRPPPPAPVQMGAPGRQRNPGRPRWQNLEKDAAPASINRHGRKVLNDAIAYLRSLAQLRGAATPSGRRRRCVMRRRSPPRSGKLRVVYSWPRTSRTARARRRPPRHAPRASSASSPPRMPN